MEYPVRTQRLLDAGYTLEQAQEYAFQKAQKLGAAGFAQEQVIAWAKSRYGFDLSPQEADYSEAFKAGYNWSVVGLGNRADRDRSRKEDAKPLGLPPELRKNANMVEQLLFSAGQFIGDVPAYVVGGVAGGAAGAPTGPGAIVTAAGGAMALPPAMRYLYIKQLEEGVVTNFEQFQERFWGASAEAAKGYATGASATVAGGAVTKFGLKALPTSLGNTAEGLAKAGIHTLGVATEVTTGATVHSAFEGRAPGMDDFTLGMAMVAGMRVGHVSSKYMASKAKDAYLDSGIHMVRVAREHVKSQWDAEHVKSFNKLHPPSIKAHVEAVQRRGFEVIDMFKKQQQKEWARQNLTTASGYEPQNAFDRAWSGAWSKIGKAYSGKAAKSRWLPEFKNVFDALDPIREVSKDTAMQMLYQEFRKLPNAATRAHRALTEHTYGLYGADRGKIVGPSLKAILKPINDRLGFSQYLKAYRAANLKKLKVFTQDSKSIEKGFQELNARNQGALNGILEQRKQLIVEGERAGYWTPEEAKRLVERNHTLLPLDKRLASKEPNWKKLTKEAFNTDPAEAHIYNIHSLYRAYELNINKLRLFEQLYRIPGKGKKALKADEIEFGAVFDAEGRLRGFKQVEGDHLAVGALDDTAPLNLYKDGKYARIAMPKEVVRAVDSLTPAEHNWLVNNAGMVSKGTRLGTIITPFFWAKMVTADLALAPIFSKNQFKPVWGHLSGSAHLLFSKMYRTKPELFKKLKRFDDIYQEAVTEGAFGASYVTQDMSHTQLRTLYGHRYQNIVNLFKRSDMESLAKALHPENTMKYLMRNFKYGAHRTGQALGRATDVLDRVARLEEYRLARQQGKSARAAAFDAREINMDFTRAGAQMKALDKAIAFLNPALQSGAKIANYAKNQPTQLAVRGLMGITLPAFYMEMVRQDIIHNSPNSIEAKNLEALTEIEQDFYLNFVNVDGTIFKLRLPFELGINFGLPAKYLARYLYKTADQQERQNLLQYMWDEGVFGEMAKAFVMPYEPNAITLFREPQDNYNLFQDRPMIAGYQMRYAPQMRSGKATSQIAKQMSLFLNGFDVFSETPWLQRYTTPTAIDHLLTAWNGQGGRQVLFLADRLAEQFGIVDPAYRDWGNLQNIPGVSTFVARTPTQAAAPLVKARDWLQKHDILFNSITELHERNNAYGELQKQIMKLPEDVTQSEMREMEKHLIKTSGSLRDLGKFSKAIRLLTNRTKWNAQDLASLMNGIQVVHEMDRVQNAINKSKGEFSPELKEALIDELTWQQIGVARQILKFKEQYEQKIYKIKKP